jgi:hypothetical protein
MMRLFQLMAVSTLVVSAGCGSKVATVSGKVTYQGKPVVYGVVSIIGPDGITQSGTIEPDGSFTVRGVGVGEGKVAVTSMKPPDGTGGKAKGFGRDAPGDDERKPADPDPAASPEVIKNWFPIPAKYGDHKQSGLTITVGDGKPANIELK